MKLILSKSIPALTAMVVLAAVVAFSFAGAYLAAYVAGACMVFIKYLR